MPSSECTDMNRTFEISQFECCEGFQVMEVQEQSQFEYLYKRFYTSIPADPVGCPVGMIWKLVFKDVHFFLLK